MNTEAMGDVVQSMRDQGIADACADSWCAGESIFIVVDRFQHVSRVCASRAVAQGFVDEFNARPFIDGGPDAGAPYSIEEWRLLKSVPSAEDKVQAMRDRGIRDALAGAEPFAWFEGLKVRFLKSDGSAGNFDHLDASSQEWREALAYARAYEANRG